MSGRPLVVIGGWLGSQTRSLRRYEALYQSLGFDVLSFIAPPTLVVEATMRSRPIQVPEQWPAKLPDHPKCMQDLAWQVLGRVHNKQSSMFLYHAFSNGGCFLYENLRRVLDYNAHEACQQPVEDILKALKSRTKGVVFDSCPAWYDEASQGGLSEALQYCTKREKLDVLIQFGPGVLLYNGKAEKKLQKQMCHQFFKYLHEDPLDVHQLYLYSKNDPLSQADKIDELFAHRHSIQKSPVLRHVWEESEHCAHLRAHPKEYKDAVELFTEVSLLRSKL